MPGTGSDPEIVDTTARRLHLEPKSPSDRRDSTANTARIASSSKQSWHPPKSHRQATSGQAWPHRNIAVKSERQTMFRRQAMAVPATKTCVTGTYRTKSREPGPRLARPSRAGPRGSFLTRGNRHALSDRLQELRARRARSFQAVDRSARQERIGQDQSDRGCRASRYPGPRCTVQRNHRYRSRRNFRGAR